jgi:hypothetical protein
MATVACCAEFTVRADEPLALPRIGGRVCPMPPPPGNQRDYIQAHCAPDLGVPRDWHRNALCFATVSAAHGKRDAMNHGYD